ARTTLTEVARRTLLAILALAAIRTLFTELLEEALQRMIVRQVVETAAIEVKGKTVAVVGRRLDAGFDADGDDGRRNGVDDIGK
ncbi:hypothetical protein, partial [Paraburkholderia sp. SIMBA_030]|uniref:hypothetical protein n=1 Tax=Paraburkholderia sp. SIMBA_030 TaxID=3085773 RepID=UPI00397C3A03